MFPVIGDSVIRFAFGLLSQDDRECLVGDIILRELFRRKKYWESKSLFTCWNLDVLEAAGRRLAGATRLCILIVP